MQEKKIRATVGILMKKSQLLFLFLFLLLFCQKTGVFAISPIYDNPGQGVYNCHDTTAIGAEYIKGGGVIVVWRLLQPNSANSLDQAGLENLFGFLRRAKSVNKKAYLHFLIYPEDPQKPFPDWLNLYDSDPANDQIEAIYTSRGVFAAPWGPKYQEKLRNFLRLFYNSLRDSNLLETVEYLEPAAGGRWATTHLWFSEDDFNKWVQAAGCYSGGPDYTCFKNKYTQGVNQVFNLYFETFPDHPLMMIEGGAPHDAGYTGFSSLLQRYGMRIMLKGAGIGTRESDCGFRENLFLPICNYGAGDKMTKCGQEPWGVNYECSGAGHGFDPSSSCKKNYQQVYESSLKNERISYYCFYSSDITCSKNQTVNIMVASHLGAQIKLVNYNLSSTSLRVGEPLTVSLTWQNSGATALIAPKKTGEKWLASSYKLFLEFVKDNQVVSYQEFDVSPSTKTWQPAKSTVDNYFQATTTTNLNIPASLGGPSQDSRITYKVYLGLTDPNGERKRFALINNDANNDLTNRRYRVSDALTVSGQGTYVTPTPGGSVTTTPIPTNSVVSTPTPTVPGLNLQFKAGINHLIWKNDWPANRSFASLPDDCPLVSYWKNWLFLPFFKNNAISEIFIANNHYYIFCTKTVSW